MEKLVSVIIPVYNIENYIGKCIDSVLAQTYKNMEILLIDDGSTDSSGEICDSYQDRDGRIKVIHKVNGGLGSARNMGIINCTGDYIYFLDGDDYIDSDLVENCVRIMNEGNDMAYFGAIKECQGEDSYEISFARNNYNFETEKEKFNFVCSKLLNYHLGWEVCFRMFKADIIKDNSLYFENERIIFAEDYLFTFRYILFSKSAKGTDKCYYHYVERRNSLMAESNNNAKDKMRKVSLMGEKIAEYVSDIPYFSDRMYFIYYLMYEWHARECGGFWGNDIDTEFHRDCIRKYFENYEYVLEEYGSICEYVSVIIPVYNIGKYIGKCLDTVVAQSCHRMEILVVDDGSTDSSRGICDEYAKKDIRIKVLHKENGGLSSARNYGLDNAHGQYIYFLDGDDYINISLIDTCVKSMVKYKADMCIFKTEMITSNGAKPFGNSFEWGQINIEDDVVKYNFLYNKFFTYKYGWEAWNRMFKADIIREHDLRFTSERKIFAEDLLFTSCYMLYTKNIMCITSVLHSYVDREESLMHEKKEKIMIEEFNQLAECFKAELMKTDLSYCKRNFHRLYERIMYWHYGYLFMRVGIKQMRPQLRKIAETDICSKQTNKLLADKKNTIILYGKEDTIRRNGFYRFILNDNLFVYRMNGLLLKGVRLFKAIKK